MSRYTISKLTTTPVRVVDETAAAVDAGEPGAARGDFVVVEIGQVSEIYEAVEMDTNVVAVEVGEAGGNSEDDETGEVDKGGKTDDVEANGSHRKLSLMEMEALKEQRLKGHRKALKKKLAEKLALYRCINSSSTSSLSGNTFIQECFVEAVSDWEVSTHIFGLFDTEGVGYLVSSHWIDKFKQRSSTQQQLEFVELLDTAAYLTCDSGTITVEHFCSILSAKGVARKLYAVLLERSEGSVTVRCIMDFITRLSNSTPNTSFTKENLEWLESLFRAQVGNAEELRLEDFTKIVNSKNAFFAERVFQIFDRDSSGAVSLQEFLDAMHRFAGQSHEDKIHFLFRVYDIDGDGLIQHKELQHVLQACMDENGMQFSDEQVSDLTWALFEDADVEGRGEITYEALKAQLEKHDGLLENLSTSIDRWLVPVKPTANSGNIWKRLSTLKPYQCSLPYIKNNYAYLTFLAIYLAVNIGLFVSRCIQFQQAPPSYILARACGQCLNFNCAFILAVMLRNLITFARTHGLATYLPLDQHIYFHKMCGWLILAFSTAHTAAHLVNLALNVVPDTGGVNAARWSYAEWLLTMRPRVFGLIPGLAFPTGVVLIVILTIMVICSQPFVRKKGNFEVFYRTHLLYVPFFVLSILHCQNYWKWLIVPGLLYVVERGVRLVRTRSGAGRTYITSGILLPSKVTHLVIKRPSSMVFHPGDYVFVNIPAIAKYEWHPFTISSAPEQDDTLWLHIRAVGGWTHRLFDYFEEHQLRLECMGEAHSGEENLLSAAASPNKLQKVDRRMVGTISTNKRKIGFESPAAPSSGATNQGFSGDGEVEVAMTPINGEHPETVIEDDSSTNEQCENRTRIKSRPPLNKTASLPDVKQRLKLRQKNLNQHPLRSVSECVFSQSAMQQAQRNTNNLTYMNPKNKSVAKSFRYMRRKPTIIAFKTPSSDSLEVNRPPGQETNAAPTDGGEVTLEVAICTATETSQDKSPYPVVGKPLEIYLDGPYGTPSSHIFRAQHAVLVGTGIGVTPFASILQSIMHRYWQNRHQCPCCRHQWADQLPESVMNLKKVDFFWINRDQRSFEWFVSLLSQLEIEQAEQGGVMDRFLDMHMYITSALQRTDMKAVGLQLALELLHEKERRDMITGLKTRTIAGRPNWNKVFRQIRDQNKGKVTVFFCGPPQLSKILRYKCDEFGFKFRKENF